MDKGQDRENRRDVFAVTLKRGQSGQKDRLLWLRLAEFGRFSEGLTEKEIMHEGAGRSQGRAEEMPL